MNTSSPLSNEDFIQIAQFQIQFNDKMIRRKRYRWLYLFSLSIDTRKAKELAQVVQYMSDWNDRQ